MNFNTYMESRYKAFDYTLSQSILAEKFKLKNIPQGKNLVLWMGAPGSGKSTFLANAYEQNIFDIPHFSFDMPYVGFDMPCIGEDMFEQKLQGRGLSQEKQRNLADMMTQKVTENLIKSGHSFCLETSFANPKLLETVKASKKAGYKLCVCYVKTVSPTINCARIKARAEAGGPSRNFEEVIASHKTMEKHVISLIECCDYLFMLDNSKELPQTKCRIKNQEKVGEIFCQE